ncbi:MAG TPA: 50S ribosomal protein L11 methyltransferase [Hyphomicrobiaceae bacterium]|nr:50S ribosomal protein L11 methyltransferase [Hyphomicrobiaceae bacterium]
MADHKLSFHTSDRDAAWKIGGMLGEALDPAPGAVAVFETQGPAGWVVNCYFEAEPDLVAIRGLLAVDPDLATLEPRLEAIPDYNWVAISQAALPPVEAGRFIVRGSHDRARTRHRRNAIEIDAGEAFGTAHHATTYGCVLAIDRHARRRPPRRILDLGCGSGVLAIAAAKAWPAALIEASDIDATSVEVARANAAINGVAPRIRFRTGAGLPATAGSPARQYDLLIANILAGPLKRLSAPIALAVRRGGTVILSGLLVREAATVAASYVSKGFELCSRRDHTGWTVLELVRR